MIALGQTYFAIQTRKQELEENFRVMTEDARRLHLRNDVKGFNKNWQQPRRMQVFRTSENFRTMGTKDYTTVKLPRILRNARV